MRRRENKKGVAESEGRKREGEEGKERQTKTEKQRGGK
jgi:hypothetical protein